MPMLHTPSSGQTMYSVTEAARRCRVSTDTIRRRANAGLIPGARRAGSRSWDPWLIPEAGLIESGLASLEAPAAPDPGQLELALRESSARVEVLERLVASLEAHIAHQQQLINRLVGARPAAA